MISETINRILTSIVLFPVLLFCIYYSGIYFIIFLSIIYFLSSYEIIKNSRSFLFNLFSNVILIFALFSFYYLRGNTDYTFIIIYWILISTFLSDIGGYVFGKTFKGKN